MNDIIIHISDLHITDASGVFGKVNDHTLLRTDSPDANYALIDSMIEKIKEYDCKRRFLVITGDVTDIAEEDEFEIATSLFQKIVEGLKIKPENILLVPGDHEINRLSILTALREKENKGKQGYLLNEIKYEYFIPFYKQLTTKDFDFTKLIYDQITINDLVILGVNSNYKVGQDSSDGFLPLEQFDRELTEAIEKNASKNILLAVHHNISGAYQDKRTGQWVKDNRKNLIPFLEKHGVKCIFHGNEHTPKSEPLDSTGITVSDSGALAGKNPLGSFKIYEIQETDSSITIANNVYQLRNVNSFQEPTAGDWTTINPKEVRTEIEHFEIHKNEPDPVQDLIEVPAISDNSEASPSLSYESTEERLYYDNKVIQDQLYSIVRTRKLFHSGHFHWSESSRAHNWIDVSKLIEDKEDLIFVKNSIVDLIKSLGLFKNCDLIVSLGPEGNIISSKATIKFNIPHTFLPYSYRYDESHEYSKKLSFDNSDGTFKTVIIITDVVNDGRTIRKLIHEKESNFFSRVEKVIVVSLFYTGQQEIDTKILNYKNLPTDHNFEDDFEVNNIEYYSVFCLRVEKCPYGKNFRKECFIYRDELSCVHMFYNETKYKKHLTNDIAHASTEFPESEAQN